MSSRVAQSWTWSTPRILGTLWHAYMTVCCPALGCFRCIRHVHSPPLEPIEDHSSGIPISWAVSSMMGLGFLSVPSQTWGACLGHGDQHCRELKGTHIRYSWRFPSLQVDAARACFGASALSLRLAVRGPACADLHNAGHSQWLRSWFLLPSFQRQGKTSPIFGQLQKTRLCWTSYAPHPWHSLPNLICCAFWGTSSSPLLYLCWAVCGVPLAHPPLPTPQFSPPHPAPSFPVPPLCFGSASGP